MFQGVNLRLRWRRGIWASLCRRRDNKFPVFGLDFVLGGFFNVLNGNSMNRFSNRQEINPKMSQIAQFPRKQLSLIPFRSRGSPPRISSLRNANRIFE